MKLGHVHLKVSDLDEAVGFYREIFGFDVSEEIDSYVFLRRGDEHHTLALQEVNGPAQSGRDRPGLYHVAFEVESEEELRRIADRARAHAPRVTPQDHGISRSVYFDDPSGNGIEVYVDTRESRGTSLWEGRSEPFDPGEV